MIYKIRRFRNKILFLWLWYRMDQDQRQAWLQEARYILWCQTHGRPEPYKETRNG
jgi:hypothetical protein